MPKYIEANFDGRQVLLERSIESDYGRTKQIPFTETDPCNKPLSPFVAYHVYYNLYGLNVTALRLFNVYGPKGRSDMMSAQLFQASIDSSKIITIFDNGSLMRDWMYVNDVVSAFVRTLARPIGYEVSNMDCGQPVQM